MMSKRRALTQAPQSAVARPDAARLSARFTARCSGRLSVARITGVLALGLLSSLPSLRADEATSADSAWQPLPADAAAPPLADPREARGREVFMQRCQACHGDIPNELFGPPFLPVMPGTQALQARYRGALPAELDRRTDLSADFVSAVVRSGLNSMPPFRPTELSDDDLAALNAYLTRAR